MIDNERNPPQFRQSQPVLFQSGAVPGNPELVLARYDSLQVQFAAGDSIPPYEILWGPGQVPVNVLNPVETPPGSGIWRATATALQPSTQYAFVSSADNGDQLSDTVFFSTLSSIAPNPPESVSITSTSITVQFTAPGLSGDTSVNFGITDELGESVPATGSDPYTAVITGLTPNTPYFFQSQLGEFTSSIVSFSTLPSGPAILTTNAMVTFLVNGPNIFQTNQYVNWYINSDDSPVYGDNFLTSQPGQPANLAGTMAFSTSGANASPQSGDYVSARQAAGVKVCVSLGGYYYDMLLGLNSVSAVNDFMQTVCHVLLGNGDASWNKLGWDSSGFVTSSGQRVYFDGLNLDIENVGQGGNPNRPAQGGGLLPAVPLPASPAVPATGPYPPEYDYMVDACQALCTAWTAYGGTKIFSIAPLSPATTLNTKNTAPTNALGHYQPFPSPTSALSEYNAGTGIALKAMIHPTQLKYFSQVFVQAYNDDAVWAPGGANFNDNIAQWAFLAKKAQDEGGATKLILGFATQDAIPPLWNPATYPNLVNEALIYANTQLRASGYPNALISEWCDGIGFWASPSGTTTLKSLYASMSTSIPNLPPGGNAMVWADADFVLSALDPLWDTLPVTRG
jgi:hypothetical protein